MFLAWWGVTRHPQLATYDIAEGLWPIVHEKFTTEEIWGWCREALIECARYAGDAGVTLALAESSTLHQRPSRRAADGQGGGLSAPESLPRRSPHARQERGRHEPGGQGVRPAPGAVPLRRRIRAAARTDRSGVTSETTASSAKTPTYTTATSSGR